MSQARVLATEMVRMARDAGYDVVCVVLRQDGDHAVGCTRSAEFASVTMEQMLIGLRGGPTREFVIEERD